jgi:hypothetical protein
MSQITTDIVTDNHGRTVPKYNTVGTAPKYNTVGTAPK